MHREGAENVREKRNLLWLTSPPDLVSELLISSLFSFRFLWPPLLRELINHDKKERLQPQEGEVRGLDHGLLSRSYDPVPSPWGELVSFSFRLLVTQDAALLCEVPPLHGPPSRAERTACFCCVRGKGAGCCPGKESCVNLGWFQLRNWTRSSEMCKFTGAGGKAEAALGAAGKAAGSPLCMC